VGLSVALGAFLAGLIINTPTTRHETLARLLPLRDVFVAMFFVTVGMLVDLHRGRQPAAARRDAAADPRRQGRRAYGHRARVRLPTRDGGARPASGSPQIGEFSFVLVQVQRAAPD